MDINNNDKFTKVQFGKDAEGPFDKVRFVFIRKETLCRLPMLGLASRSLSSWSFFSSWSFSLRSASRSFSSWGFSLRSASHSRDFLRQLKEACLGEELENKTFNRKTAR